MIGPDVGHAAGHAVSSHRRAGRPVLGRIEVDQRSTALGPHLNDEVGRVAEHRSRALVAREAVQRLEESTTEQHRVAGRTVGADRTAYLAPLFGSNAAISRSISVRPMAGMSASSRTTASAPSAAARPARIEAAIPSAQSGASTMSTARPARASVRARQVRRQHDHDRGGAAGQRRLGHGTQQRPPVDRLQQLVAPAHPPRRPGGEHQRRDPRRRGRARPPDPRLRSRGDLLQKPADPHLARCRPN